MTAWTVQTLHIARFQAIIQLIVWDDKLEWKDIISHNVLVYSHCEINLCGVIKMEFQINHGLEEDEYILIFLPKEGKIQHTGYTAMRWRGSGKRLIIWWLLKKSNEGY